MLLKRRFAEFPRTKPTLESRANFIKKGQEFKAKRHSKKSMSYLKFLPLYLGFTAERMKLIRHAKRHKNYVIF